MLPTPLELPSRTFSKMPGLRLVKLSDAGRGLTRLAIAAIAGLALTIASCSSDSRSTTSPAMTSGAMGLVTEPAPVETAAPVITTEAWTFETIAGKLISTTNYRIYTTATSEAMLTRLPTFAEAALKHYTSVLAPLPAPDAPMDTFIMGNRPQWERLTLRVMGSDADPYLQIARGGFAARGKAVLWDIGRRDTFTITAHEGWHQYTQNNFEDPLPIVYEEGIATYMEGFRWTTSDRTTPQFLPWANWERFGQLREAVAEDRTLSLGELLREAPQDLMSRGGDSPLDYYAQVWALTLFLMEGDDGAYREPFVEMVKDAQAGTLRAKIRDKFGGRSASIHAMRRRGIDVLSAYTGIPTETLNDRYQAFMKETVRTGAGQAISRGESPHAKSP
jgi:hypothetical protein